MLVLVVVVATVISLVVLFLAYRALPLGRGTLLGLAAVVSALGGLIAAFIHLL